MRQFNIEVDKTSPKTSRFVVPANEHFSILVRYKNWEDKQEWLDYTLVDDAGTDVVKYKKEAENDSALYFCGIMDTSTNLRFKTSTLASTLAPRDTMQVVAIASSTQDNCYICSADYARTTGEGGGGGGGGVSQEYVDGKVQEEAVARAAADEALRTEIPTKTSELSNDSGFLTKAGTIDNALSAEFASNVRWSGVADKPIASATELGLVKVGSNLTIDADGKLNAVGGTGGVSQEYVDSKVQEEATAREAADDELRAEIPTKTSQLTNDSGFLTEHQSLSDYYTKTEVDGKVQEEAGIRQAADESLRADIPTKTSQLENDSGYFTETQLTTDYYNKTEVDTNIDELKAAMPTMTSQLENDSGFLTYEGTIANADTANTSNNVDWSGVQSKPTTLDGYGITDAATKAEFDSLAAEVGTANAQLEEIA